ncbi:MAG: hypothetical protein OEV40_07595 [Acidimicrobiia bacterium]|nr:hypothetical protein [Acidimicrobiia bacterium]
MLFDRRCPGCGRASSSICASCYERLERPTTSAGADLLAGILADRVDALTAAFRYDDRVARLIVQGKNGARRDVLRALGDGLGRCLRHEGAGAAPIDAIAWVPASRSRRHRRGYDHGRVLARRVDAALGVGAERLLARHRGGAQANRSRSERLAGPTITAARRAPNRVLLVDDVATTGATLAVCADVLRDAGAGHVTVGVVAVVDPVMGFTGWDRVGQSSNPGGR